MRLPWGDIACQYLAELLGRHRPTEIVSFTLRTAVRLQDFKLFSRFHPFAYNWQMEAPCLRNNGPRGNREPASEPVAWSSPSRQPACPKADDRKRPLRHYLVSELEIPALKQQPQQLYIEDA